MPDRINVPGARSVRPKILRPVARPVDTYVQPGASGLSQLSSSLSELVPSLARFAGRMGEEKAQKDKMEGEARAREMVESGKTFAEAVRTGTIRPDESPWFRVGFYETTGRVEGGRYIGNFLEALNASPVAESVELDDFDTFEREFRQKYVAEKLGDNTDDFLANAFGTTVDGQMAGIRNAFAQQAGTRMVNQNKEMFHSEIFQMVEEFRANDVAIEDRAAAIRLAQERQVVTRGMDYAQVNRITAEAVGAAAYALRDIEVLQLLFHMPTDPTSRGYIGGTSYGAEIIEKAEMAITRAIDADTRRDMAAEERRVATGQRTIINGLVDTLQRDPGADISSFIDLMQDVDPLDVGMIERVSNSIAGGVYTDDPVTLQDLVIGIHAAAPGTAEYTTQQDLTTALSQRRLTPQKYLELSKTVNERDEGGGAGRFLQNPVLTSIYNEVRGTFTSEFAWDTEVNRFNANQAAQEAKFAMLQWLIAHPDATPSQTEEAKNNISNQAVRSRMTLRTEAENSRSGLTVPKIPNGRFFVADRVQSGTLTREFEQVQAGTRNGYSILMKDVLRRNKIDPTKPKDIEKFLREQHDWMTSAFQRP